MSATVFIVEDDVDTREMLGRFLELEGYRVESAPNGKLALERLGAGVGPCVILLDLMMPVMDGWRFREEQLHDPTLASIPVVVISANAEQGGRRIEADAVIPKPVDFEQLLRTIDAHTRDRARGDN